MKAVFFNKPLELSLEIKGEKWHQGDKVEGSLSVKNHSGEDINLEKLGVLLAVGNTKKVKNKDPEAFVVEASRFFSDSGELSLDFEFQLNEDCPISENASSYYLICGKDIEHHEIGHMRLDIVPAETLSNFLEVLLDTFRFKVKTFKNKKGSIEVTMVVPDHKDYSNIGQYKILMKVDDDKIVLKHQFKIKKIIFEDGGQQIKDETRSIDQELTSDDYLIYGKAVNRAGISKRFEEVLEQVKFKPLI